MATTQYSNSFDSLAAGTTLAAFTAGLVLAGAAVSAPNGYGLSAPADGATFRLSATGIPNPVADHGILYSMQVGAASSDGTTAVSCSAQLRQSADGTSGYTLLFQPDHWFLFNGTGAGTFSKITDASLALFSVGTQVWVRAEAQGTTVRFRIWAYGTTEPTAWTVSLTDSTVTQAGYPGWYVVQGSSGPVGIDDLVAYSLATTSTPTPTVTPTPTSTTTPTPTPTPTVSPTPTPMTPTTPTPTTPTTPTPTTPTTTTTTASLLTVSGIGCYLSPYNWDDDGAGAKRVVGTRIGATTAWTPNAGAYGRFGWATPLAAGNVAQLEFDTSFLTAAAVPPAFWPVLEYWVGNGPTTTVQFTAGTNGLLNLDVTGAGVSGAGTYVLSFVVKATSQQYGRWTPGSGVVPPNTVKLNGLIVDAGSAAVAPPQLEPLMAVFGDSTTEGVEASGTNNGDLVSNDALSTYCRPLAQALGCEVGVVAYGGQGFERPGLGGVPPIPQSISLYGAGRARDFTPPASFVLIIQGANDGLANVADALVTADSAGLLATARARFGATVPLFLGVPFGGFKRAALEQGFAQYQAGSPDAAAFLLDLGLPIQAGLTGFVTGGTWAAPGDGVHPGYGTHARIAAALEGQILAALNSAAKPAVLTTAVVQAIEQVPALVTATNRLIQTAGITLGSGQVYGTPTTTTISTIGTNPNGIPDFGRGQGLLLQSGLGIYLRQPILGSTFIPATAVTPAVTTFTTAAFPVAPKAEDLFVIS